MGELVSNPNPNPNPNPNANLNSNLMLTLTLGLLFLCEEANTNFIQRRSKETDPRSEAANYRFINFCELTLDLRVLTIDLRELALGLRLLAIDLLIL